MNTVIDYLMVVVDYLVLIVWNPAIDVENVVLALLAILAFLSFAN